MAEAKRRSRIDVHHHFFAPEYLAVMGDMAKRPVVRDWTAARSLEEMDKNGIGTAILSVLRKEGEISTVFSKPDFASPKVPFQ